ncbi:MAG: hypothetical protein ACRDQA_16865 [Nocardioidaceae bacterium]
MYTTDIPSLCSARGWSRARLIAELRRAAGSRQITLPADASLKRMVREWANGRRGLSDFYASLLSATLGVSFTEGRGGSTVDDSDDGQQDELAQRLNTAAAVDGDLVRRLEDQTQGFRLLDRRLGARRLLQQTELHLDQITDLLDYCVANGHRANLAAAAAETAALAGWQALDLGDPSKTWQHHETAKTTARQSDNLTILAHVTAQQGYALLDLQRGKQAVSLMRHAREQVATAAPALLRAWLWAAEGESLASIGEAAASRKALDESLRLLPAESADPELPFIVLNEGHLSRWRGHCLARLGAREAVEELTAAIASHDTDFTRAAASLHCDLALAHSVRGDHELARAEALRSADLADQSSSVRQRRRLKQLLTSGEEQ